MKNDEITAAPPDDMEFQRLMLGAINGRVLVFGAVLETAKVSLVRAWPEHRPELTKLGKDTVTALLRQWQEGHPIQPWLYVRDGRYVVADDYHWLALIEDGHPESFAAQILGEPLQVGLVSKIGPLSQTDVRAMMGLS